MTLDFQNSYWYITHGLVYSLQALVVMKTKMVGGEDLQGMLPTTASGDELIEPRVASLMTVEQAQGEGLQHVLFSSLL